MPNITIRFTWFSVRKGPLDTQFINDLPEEYKSLIVGKRFPTETPKDNSPYAVKWSDFIERILKDADLSNSGKRETIKTLKEIFFNQDSDDFLIYISSGFSKWDKRNIEELKSQFL